MSGKVKQAVRNRNPGAGEGGRPRKNLQLGRVWTWKNAGGLSYDNVEEILVVVCFHHWVKH